MCTPADGLTSNRSPRTTVLLALPGSKELWGQTQWTCGQTQWHWEQTQGRWGQTLGRVGQAQRRVHIRLARQLHKGQAARAAAVAYASWPETF